MIETITRAAFRAHFGTSGPVVLPVIHVLDDAQAIANAQTALAGGAAGIFLINHDFAVDRFLPIIRATRNALPDAWIGVNFLAVTGRDAFPILGELAATDLRINAYWADDARIDERKTVQAEAGHIADQRRASGRHGLYFGGTVFKKQRPVAARHWQHAAGIAANWMDAVTTSGVATGAAADRDKIAAFRHGAGDRPLALASGITPENAHLYAEVDALMVATGINYPGDFYRIDPARLSALMAVTREMGEAV